VESGDEMTLEEFKSLPVGTVVRIKYDDGTFELGEIIRTGVDIHITWPESRVTSILTATSGWESFLKDLEVDE
jgi:hypothetical protein